MDILNNYRSELLRSVTKLSGIIENTLDEALQVVTHRRFVNMKNVMTGHREANDFSRDVNLMALQAIAKLAPYGQDLRFFLSIFKLTSDMMALSRNAVQMTKSSELGLKEVSFIDKEVLDTVNALVRRMLTDSIDSFLKGNIKSASYCLELKSDLDPLVNGLIQSLKVKMKEDMDNIDAYLEQYQILRTFENIGDISKHIAYESIFVITGNIDTV